MCFLKTKIITLFTLVLCMGVFSVTALASDGGETLTVTAAWVDGELLRINVTDANGVNSALALRLSDYITDAENKEYISIQAVDLAGNKSGIIEIKNPFYDPSAVPIAIATPTSSEPSQSAAPDGTARPFTPDGSGTVIDNVHEGDGKEFFTIGTEDGSVFYLIVDRQRNADNVYLLNVVTEQDLMALAEKNGREITTNAAGESAIQTSEHPTAEQTEPPTVPTEAATETPEIPPAKSDATMYIIIALAVLAVGGAGYYFKIVRGKKNAYDDSENDEDNDGDEYGYSDESDEMEDGGDGK